MRFTTNLIFIFVFAFGAVAVTAQEPAGEVAATPAPTPELSESQQKGIQIVESVILIYSNLRGREGMKQIRKTALELGSIEIAGAEGKMKKGSYEQRTLRGESLTSSKIRLDQSFPDARYALIYDGSSVFGLFNTEKFKPDAIASGTFSNRIWRGLDAFLGYYETGSTVVFDRDDKVMGVDYSVVKLTDKENRETSFYVSKKSFRVMMIEFEMNGTKYRRKFYDYNYAQNTLFPYRTILWADGKKVEEQKTSTITFGQEIAEQYFNFS